MARVLFFGRLRDIAGAAALDIDVATLSQLRARIAEHNPALADAIAAPGISVAVDKAICREDARLSAVSEVAFMPPLSGG